MMTKVDMSVTVDNSTQVTTKEKECKEIEQNTDGILTNIKENDGANKF